MQLLALLWKVIRTYALQWFRRYLGRFAIWGTVALLGLLAIAALIVLLLSAL